MNDPLLIILALAAITYGFRLGGLLAAGYLPEHGRWAYALKQLPGAVLIAVWLPSTLALGPLGVAAGVLSAALMLLTKSVFFAMIAGSAAMAAGRAMGWG